MKILHTADWHIGKVLHKHPLHEEMDLFFDWMIDFIKSEAIDVLLISGDIFDLANPGAKDRATYYQLLSRLVPLHIEIIITGGNHDGIGVINAPKELLDALHIHVIGGAKANLEEELIEIKNKNEELELVVAAVPFLRDRDLRSLKTDKQYETRAEAIRAGIENHYKGLANICKDKYHKIPCIAMGHLYAKGVSTSDSERDIHIGNAAAVEASIFPKEFDYIALGHIHRPQIIAKNEFIRYSGSPISLSFSEKSDKKGILLLEVNDAKIEKPKFVEIPKLRELKKISGDVATVSAALKTYENKYKLPALLELEFKEQDFSEITLAKVSELVAQYENHKAFTILKSKTEFSSGVKDTADLFKSGENIEDLSPADVFEKRISSEELDDSKKKELLETFQELMEMVQAEGE